LRDKRNGIPFEEVIQFWPDLRIDLTAIELGRVFYSYLINKLDGLGADSHKRITGDTIMSQLTSSEYAAVEYVNNLSTKTFGDLPKISKADILNNYSRYINSDLVMSGECFVKSTSGSSGPSLKVFYDAKFYAEELFLAVPSILADWGCRDFTGFFALNISDSHYRQSSVYIFPEGKIGAQIDKTVDFRSHESVQRIWKFLERFRPRVLTSRPELLESLCLTQPVCRSSVGLEYIISSGSFLAPKVRNLVEQVFSAPVIDVYASSELGIVGWQTPVSKEVIPNNSRYFVEVCGSDLVISGIENFAMPLVRYNTMDRVAKWCQLTDGSLQLEFETDRYVPLYRDLNGRIVVPVCYQRKLNDIGVWNYTLHSPKFGVVQAEVESICNIEQVKAAMDASIEATEIRMKHQVHLRGGPVSNRRYSELP
jgi:hypothetical protein